METIEALRRRIQSAEDLHSVVKTMKTLAAVSIQHYQQAVQSLAEYHRAVELGLQVLMRNRPERILPGRRVPGPRLGAVIVGSDQGMCGQFNEEIVDHAIEEIGRLVPRTEDRFVLVVGLRAVLLVEEAGQPIIQSFAIPASLFGVAPMVQELVLQMETLLSESGVERFFVFNQKPLSSATSVAHTLQLLPLDPEWLALLARADWPGPTLPTHTMDWDRLFGAMVRQYLLVSLYRAVVESLAAENAARLTAMQAAESNIEDRIGELTTAYHHLRQTSITEELLDLVGGFEALMQPES